MPRQEFSEKRDRMTHIQLTYGADKRLRVHVAEQKTTIQDWVEALIERQLPGR